MDRTVQILAWGRGLTPLLGWDLGDYGLAGGAGGILQDLDKIYGAMKVKKYE